MIPLPETAGPPPIPWDVSESPENVKTSRGSFSLFLEQERAALEQPAARKGASGGRGGVGDLERALSAARELMCCYGRLEAELRIVEVSGGIQ